jgi:uncharacterized protein YutE (UPF0331/DUF86 family)
MKSLGLIDDNALQEWKKIVGLRNTIAHEYMKINIALVKAIVGKEQYRFVLDFLNTPFMQFFARRRDMNNLRTINRVHESQW